MNTTFEYFPLHPDNNCTLQFLPPSSESGVFFLLLVDRPSSTTSSVGLLEVPDLPGTRQERARLTHRVRFPSFLGLVLLLITSTS